MDSMSSDEPIDCEYVDTPESLADLCRHIGQADWVAIDTEFLREKTYYPKLCLIQVAIPGLKVCIDPLAIEDISDLLAVLNKPSITKVLHACSQDLEIFMQLSGQVPTPLFDTQIAAPLLGLPEQAGYAALVETLLDIKLEKGLARTDWSKRPLSKKQIRYALDDVIYLAELYPIMLDKLSSLGRLAWLKDDFMRYESPDRYTNNPENAWLRIRGYDRLNQKQLGALQTLASWREIQAQQENRPRAWLLRDNVLLDLARIYPENHEELASVRQIPEAFVKKHGEELLRLIAQSASMKPQQLPAKTRRRKPSLKQDALADVLQAQVTLQAEKNTINPATLATRKQLQALVMGETDVPIMSGWRLEMAGRELMAMLNGERTLSVKNSELIIIDVS